MPDQPDPAATADAPSMEAKQRLSRREFARRAALASAVASIAPAAALAAPSTVGQSINQDPPPPTRPAPVAPQNPLPNAPKLSVESQSEADARFQSILVLYGSRFSNEQKIDLHRLCAVVQPALDHIRAYKIENGDGPALYLKPQYEREKKPKPPAAVPAKSAPGQTGPAKSTPAPKSAPPASAPKKP
jgi:hypothetical protein